MELYKETKTEFLHRSPPAERILIGAFLVTVIIGTSSVIYFFLFSHYWAYLLVASIFISSFFLYYFLHKDEILAVPMIITDTTFSIDRGSLRNFFTRGRRYIYYDNITSIQRRYNLNGDIISINGRLKNNTSFKIKKTEISDNSIKILNKALYKGDLQIGKLTFFPSLNNNELLKDNILDEIIKDIRNRNENIIKKIGILLQQFPNDINLMNLLALSYIQIKSERKSAVELLEQIRDMNINKVEKETILENIRYIKNMRLD
jgi:hypothetical protein